MDWSISTGKTEQKADLRRFSERKEENRIRHRKRRTIWEICARKRKDSSNRFVTRLACDTAWVQSSSRSVCRCVPWCSRQSEMWTDLRDGVKRRAYTNFDKSRLQGQTALHVCLYILLNSSRGIKYIIYSLRSVSVVLFSDCRTFILRSRYNTCSASLLSRTAHFVVIRRSSAQRG
jgi:hypothetical protein